MKLAVDMKQYYGWEMVWSSESRAKAEELLLAFYKVGIVSQLKEANEQFELWAPYTKAAIARELSTAFDQDLFEYPDAIVVNRTIKSYNRFQPVKRRRGGSWAILMLGLAFLMLALVKIIYQLIL